MSNRVWNHNKIAYGGDYNPEQWGEDIWAEDMRLFKLAHIDTVTLNVFSWASLQPNEDTYDFSKLDKIMALVRENGMKVILATSTGAHPAWMAKKYPEILRSDRNGIHRRFGSRHNSCPNSPVYRKFSVALADKLAEHYADWDNIIAWHISNEYGGECYCDNCAKAFRVWLEKRYGSLDNLNRAWNTAFWSHTFYDWDEIELPDYRTEEYGENSTAFQSISLDYRRFNSESIQTCCRLEYEAIKKHTPNIPITTNFMETYKPLDYQAWAKDLDFVSWDNYPQPTYTPGHIALNHELIRGLKPEQPFVLMEQTPSVTNWQTINAIKRPGVMRLWSYQAVAHGSDSILFFQMRRSRGASEKYHGAVIDHVGTEHTRVFREISALGAELDKLGSATLGTRVEAEVAILFDWNNWWAVELSSGPSTRMRYLDEVLRYYEALHERNVAADIVAVDADLSRYKVVLAPVLYMVKPGVDEKLREFVKNGGTLLTTFLAGYVDETDLVTLGGYPGKLRDILGIWVEEIDDLPEGQVNHFTYEGVRHDANVLCDLLHSEGAEVLATYEEDFYAGMPVLTCNHFGKGKAYYAATQFDDGFYTVLMDRICKEQGVAPAAVTPEGVEAVVRSGENGRFLFLLNFAPEAKTVTMPQACTDLLTDNAYEAGTTAEMAPKDVMILELRG